LGRHLHAKVVAGGNGQDFELDAEFAAQLLGLRVVLLAEKPIQLWPHLLDVLRIDRQERLDALLELGLELPHPCGQIEVEIRRQQPVALVSPGQRDLVEVLANLTGERSQFVEFVGPAQQLLVVAAGAHRGAVPFSHVAADTAIVFDGRPDADVDGGEHGAFLNHWTTSWCSMPKRMKSGVCVMARSRAAASRMAITRISAGIRSRYLRPRAMELSLITRPSAVEIAICADGSVGSGADSGLSRISSIDGNWRKRRRKASSSADAACPTVPSSNCASNSPAPVRKAVFCLRATPQRTCEAISQERGVGQALASEVVSAACRRSGLKRRKAMISGRTPALTAHLHQSLRSASSSRWTKRFLRGRGIAKCTPRSDAGLPAAMTTHPSGSTYSPSLRSRTSW